MACVRQRRIKKIHSPHDLLHSLYKPVTITNALFIRLVEGNAIFFFLKQGLVMGVGGLHGYCQLGKHLISHVDTSHSTNEPSALIRNMLLHVFLG